MTDILVSRDEIKQRARKAFASGLPRSACPFNWSPVGAYADWMAEYERLEELRALEICKASIMPRLWAGAEGAC